MIRIEAKGFQSIKDPVTLLLEGLTVLEGESNRGKSALVRLIHAAFSNRPGTHYINVNTDTAALTWQDPSNYLVWEKEGSSTTYTVNGKTLHKPGRGVVPQEVRQIGLGEIRTSDKRRFWPQIQFQDDAPFIISEKSPDIIAELLGSSPELLKIARALKLVKGDLNKLASLLEAQDAQLRATTERVQLLEGLCQDTQQPVLVLETLFNQKEQAEQRVMAFSRVKNQWDLNQQQGVVHDQIKQQTFPVAPDANRVIVLDRLWRRYQEIEQIQQITKSSSPIQPVPMETRVRFSRLHNLYGRSLKVARRLVLLKPVSTQIQVPEFLDQNSWLQRGQYLQKVHQTYVKVLRSQEALDKELVKVTVHLKDVDHELKHLKATIGDLEVCPVCNGPLQPDFLAKIPVG
jgi:hypothetical protein